MNESNWEYSKRICSIGETDENHFNRAECRVAEKEKQVV